MIWLFILLVIAGVFVLYFSLEDKQHKKFDQLED